VKDGIYYSEPPYTGSEGSNGPSAEGENTGQEYLSALAIRALIFIEADNPNIGLICMMPVGMVEVSTCGITVKEGEHVKRRAARHGKLPHSQKTYAQYIH
jgi:phosphatidylserine decarboxylase